MDTVKLTEIFAAVEQHAKAGLIQEVKQAGIKDVCITRDSNGVSIEYSFIVTGPFVTLDNLAIGHTEANKTIKKVIMDKLVKAYQKQKLTEWQSVIK